MRLHTDFEDYYDAALLRRDAPPLWRQRRGLFDRRRGLEIAQRAGWRTVAHGTLEDLVRTTPQQDQRLALLVFYDDYTANGLVPCADDPSGFCDPLSPVGMLKAQEPDSGCTLDEWATRYIEQMTHDLRPVSLSHVAVGHRQFTVYYENLDSIYNGVWASNRGRYISRVTDEVTHQFGGVASPAIPFPLWSIDYVFAPDRRLNRIIPHVIELNVAPVLHDMGFRGVLTEEEVAEAISTRALELAREEDSTINPEKEDNGAAE